MKIMILTPYLPHGTIGHGGGTAVRDLVTSLAKKHEVQVVSLVRPRESQLLAEVRALGVQVVGIPFRDQTARNLQKVILLRERITGAYRSLVSGFPYFVQKYWSGDIARQIIAAAESFAPQAIQIEYLQMGLYCRDLKKWRGDKTNPRLILNSHELGSVPRQRHAFLAGNPLDRLLSQRDADLWRKYQVISSTWADHTLCVTPQDHQLFHQMGGQNLVTMPLGMDTEKIIPNWNPTLPERFLFMGSFQHRPNFSAATFLVEKVWPKIREQRPHSQLLLVGRGSQVFLATQPTHLIAGIEALGFVDDLTNLFSECRLFLAPLTEGGGIKIKILEAMARGIPVVTSPIGAEGITSDPAILAITPCDDSFATTALAAAADLATCNLRALAARKLIEDQFSWQAIANDLTSLYNS